MNKLSRVRSTASRRPTRVLLFFVLAFLFFTVSCVPRPAGTEPGASKSPARFDHSPDPGTPPPTEPAAYPSSTGMPTEFPTPFVSPAVPTPGADPTDIMQTIIPSTSPVTPGVSPSLPPEPSASPVPSGSPDTGAVQAVFLGVKGYGQISASAVQAPGARVYRFLINGTEQLCSVRNTGGFPIQNLLMENCRYELRLIGSEVVSARLIDPQTQYEPPVSCAPGQRTLRSFLTTAFMPMGTALYVYGGGWDWQDEGSSIQSRTIGVAGSWVDFFRQNNENYLYKDENHPESSTYPFGGWNEYYYAGLDCSGYLGWVLYNTLETHSGNTGYVFKSSTLAKKLAERYGFGTFHTERFELGAGPFMPGDIVSMSGHVYIVLGRCGDGSILILHSTVSGSVTGVRGGGVQLGVLDPHNSKNCEAYRLAERYTSQYFPEWARRYPIAVKSFDQYVGFDRNGTTGVFRWSIGSGGLSDPDGIRGMSADRILALIFGQ